MIPAQEETHTRTSEAVPPSGSPRSTRRNPIVRTRLSGYDLLNSPRLNKGTAFTEAERDAFGLHGLLPPHEGTLQEQIDRRERALAEEPTAFAQYTFMRDLEDANETIFYALIAQNIERLLPIVYTPTVGEGCQRFSQIWRKARGLFISYPNRHRIDRILSDCRYDDVRCIVVSDGERILGLGDQGAGGMGIPIGKMALYTALGGIPPEHCLPVLLDVGTDNEERLKDPIYVGWGHHRIRGQEYDDFVEAFVAAVMRRWPNILLQWEDFAGANASRLLDRYRNRLCTFNDDIQGTAAVATATILAAVRATGVPLREQKIAIFGFGSAGIGVASLLAAAMEEDGLSDSEARGRFYAIDQFGLVVEGGAGLRPEQEPFARSRAEIAGWDLTQPEGAGLLDVVRNARPTVLMGFSAQPGAFSEAVVREMARHTARPVISPLSNPTSRSEATPENLLRWTDGAALVGTGSPFPPVEIGGRSVAVTQTNNSYIFPGLALGILTSQARRVSDGMIMASARALAELSTGADGVGGLLPRLADSRRVSFAVAKAVGRQAIREGLAGMPDEETFLKALRDYVWDPIYVPYERIP